jgi:choline-sulfatase
MTATNEPNILVIQTDQHSRRVTGCYGNETVRTPSIDRLADDGMRFENAYCPAPVCVPSRMSFMTSRTPSNNRVWTNKNVLHSAVPTWAHVLGTAGYETALVGRMHFEGPDQRHGFQERRVSELGFLTGYPGRPEPLWSGEFRGVSGPCRRSVEKSGIGTTQYQEFDQRVTDAAVEYLRERAASDASEPFAAVVGYVLPHCPFIAPENLFEYYYDRVEVPRVEDGQPESVEVFRRNRGILDPPPEERIRIARAAYFALCEYVDSLVGRVLETLEQTDLAENTLVVYCSDHGEMASEHGCWWKQNYYEESVGVPLIARLPGRITEGSVADAVVNLTDLGPTFAEVAGTEFPTPVDGQSLWPTLTGNHPDDWADETYSEFVDNMCGDVGPSRMIRSGRWKLWEFGTADLPPALFDLETDPRERTDLGEDPEYADVRDRLREKLYENWDPATVRTECGRQEEWFESLSEWGSAVEPDHLEAVEMRPRDHDDFELF